VTHARRVRNSRRSSRAADLGHDFVSAYCAAFQDQVECWVQQLAVELRLREPATARLMVLAGQHWQRERIAAAAQRREEQQQQQQQQQQAAAAAAAAVLPEQAAEGGAAAAGGEGPAREAAAAGPAEAAAAVRIRLLGAASALASGLQQPLLQELQQVLRSAAPGRLVQLAQDWLDGTVQAAQLQLQGSLQRALEPAAVEGLELVAEAAGPGPGPEVLRCMQGAAATAVAAVTAGAT
jgi:hypothetical protein